MKTHPEHSPSRVRCVRLHAVHAAGRVDAQDAADGSNVVKRNATIPVKFRVCDFNGVSIGTPGVVTSFTLMGVNMDPLSTTPHTAFRWDPAEQQWIFNLSTKDLAAGATYVYRIGLADGSSIEFTVEVR